MQTQTNRDCLGSPGWQHWRPTHQGRMCTCGRRWNSRRVVCSGQCLLSVQNVAEENRETEERRGEKRKRSLTPNVHKPTQKMHLPPTLINLSAWRAAPAQQTPPKLLLKKGSYLFLGTVLSHDTKCYCNKQSHRNQKWNVKLQNQFLRHTYRHRSGNLIFIFKALCICAWNCAGGEGYQNLKLF